MKQRNWTNMQELFNELNNKCNYLVMRNYENICSDEFIAANDSDIDMLCDNCKLAASVLDAKRAIGRINYTALVQGKKVSFGLSYVGDKEYDPLWQKEMLNNRRLNENGFYTMNENDKFYSSVYHYILHKKQLTKDKHEMLLQMAKINGIQAKTEAEFLEILQDMMDSKGYFFWYPENRAMACRFNLVPAEKCKGKISWYMRKIKAIPFNLISYIKHGRIGNG